MIIIQTTYGFLIHGEEYKYEAPHWVAFSSILSFQNILLVIRFSNAFFECQRLGFEKMQRYGQNVSCA
jgi:hypothetical protein